MNGNDFGNKTIVISDKPFALTFVNATLIELAVYIHYLFVNAQPLVSQTPS